MESDLYINYILMLLVTIWNWWTQKKKSCTKSCTFNQKWMSNQVDTPFSSPKVCFVFGRIAWPVLCHFCMGSLHYFLFKHHATVPWTFVNLHTSIQEDTKRWHSQCSQGHKQLDVTLAPKPSSDHHYNNYKHHSLFPHKTIESAC